MGSMVHAPRYSAPAVRGMLVAFVMVMVGLVALVSHGCSGTQTPPGVAPTTNTAAVVSLTIAEGAVTEAEALESSSGLTGTDLSDYDHLLHTANDGLGAALDHVQHGADACTLHRDAARATDAFTQIAGIFQAHSLPVPGDIMRGVGRLVAVIEQVLLPCDGDSGMGLGMRLRAAYGHHPAFHVPVAVSTH